MIGLRIREERDRVGIKQTELADITGVKPLTVINWEKGSSSPTAVQLSAMSDAGMDVTYIVTGHRLSDTLNHNIELMMKVTAEAVQKGASDELSIKAIQAAVDMARDHALSSITDHLKNLPDEDVRLVAKLVEKIASASEK